MYDFLNVDNLNQYMFGTFLVLTLCFLKDSLSSLEFGHMQKIIFTIN
jgi:hypothetical protein